MIDSLLIANRGEIARRIIRTASRLGIRTVAVHSDVDGGLPYVREADESYALGAAAPAQSYLDMDALLDVARQAGVAAVHPGYGFLAESADFARRVQDSGLAWVGPSPAAIEAMGDKINARTLMQDAGVPVAPGTHDPVTSAEGAVRAGAEIGYPIMVKASAGGGGIGMGVARDEKELRTAFTTARTRAERFFSSPDILLERYIEGARHVEIQVFGDGDGNVVALGDRDCSVQRRHQKVLEETPSPGVSTQLRERMLEGAIAAAKAVDYRNAGTVECLVDPAAQEYVFLEMNTRLQVEHPVTEMVTGVDLVEEQLRVASGLVPSRDLAAVEARGHSMELRVYAEDPIRFLPSPGEISSWHEPMGEGVRVDSGYQKGDVVTPYYDPLLAKVCVWGKDREEALERASRAVQSFEVSGPRTNLPFFTELLANPEFRSGSYDTSLIARMNDG